MKEIYNDNGFLNFSAGRLATQEEYELSDRCVGSIFESLSPGERIVLQEGVYQLDEDLDLGEWSKRILPPKNSLEYQKYKELLGL